MLDQLAKYERTKLTERARRGKMQKARQGKMPGRRPPMGFLYANDEFTVDEPRMAHVRRLFRMVGVEGEAMAAVKRAFDRDGVSTQGGAERWDTTTIRRMIGNDAYLSRSYGEVAALVSPGVAAGLDPERAYGVFWFNRQRHKRVHAGPKRNVRRDNDASEWIAVPVPDGGIPREWVEGARAAVRDNARPPDAGRRFWELKSLLFCPCGRRLTTHTAVRRHGGKEYPSYHYVCSHHRRRKAGPCEHARYHTAEHVEGRLRRLILDLARRPEVMAERVREDAERERGRLGNADRERAAFAEEMARVERRRDALIEMRADGDITKEKFREKVAGLDARKAAAKRELRTLEVSAERLRFLDSLPALVEEYVRELPHLVHGTEGTVHGHALKDGYRREGRIEPYRLTPEVLRERTPEEMEALRDERERERGRRYRALYELLGLGVVVRKDGTLDVSGTFGLKEASLADEPSAAWKAVTGEGLKMPPDDPHWDGGTVVAIGVHRGERRLRQRRPSLSASGWRPTTCMR